jgi:hypothetical protein
MTRDERVASAMVQPMVRLLLALSVLSIAVVAGCGESRRRMPDAGSVGTGGAQGGTGGRGQGTAGGGADAGRTGTGDTSGGRAGLGGRGASGGASGTPVCSCDSTTPECEMGIAEFCLFQSAHCPPTLDESLQGILQSGLGFAAYYVECPDGVRYFDIAVSPFEGSYAVAYAADGSVIYAAGPRPDIGPPVCGSVPLAIDEALCRTCRVPLQDASGTGGMSGASGGSGAGGAAGADAAGPATADPSGILYCLVDATGALLMPPE